ncbi:Uncharacterised protein [Vibrio cholerae]|nr:Uncharacterised protein [Vibrio cholerae]CSI51964.1 Uncharacterised protein [Vibrio cholerae]
MLPSGRLPATHSSLDIERMAFLQRRRKARTEGQD